MIDEWMDGVIPYWTKRSDVPWPTAGRERGASLTPGVSHVGFPSSTSKAIRPAAEPTKTDVCLFHGMCGAVVGYGVRGSSDVQCVKKVYLVGVEGGPVGEDGRGVAPCDRGLDRGGGRG